MIKEIINQRGYIIELHRCKLCNEVLFTFPGDYDEDNYGEWKFCPYCGNPINYNEEE